METLLGDVTVYCFAIPLTGKRAGTLLKLSNDHMPRQTTDRMAVRKRIDGCDVLFINSTRGQKDAKKAAEQAFRDYMSGKQLFILDEIYAVTDD